MVPSRGSDSCSQNHCRTTSHVEEMMLRLSFPGRVGTAQAGANRGVGVGPGVGPVFCFVLASFLAAKSGVTAERSMQGLLIGTRPRRLCNVAY